MLSSWKGLTMLSVLTMRPAPALKFCACSSFSRAWIFLMKADSAGVYFKGSSWPNSSSFSKRAIISESYQEVPLNTLRSSAVMKMYP